LGLFAIQCSGWYTELGGRSEAVVFVVIYVLTQFEVKQNILKKVNNLQARTNEKKYFLSK